MLKSRYPGWNVTRTLDSILQEKVEAEREQRKKSVQ
jgi:hypothetical protein